MNPSNTEYKLNFTIPQGIPGPTGPTGPDGTNIARSAYIVTFNNGTVTSDGIVVDSEERLPLDLLELDISNLVTLDTANETIQFNIPGYYKISFTVSAYAKHLNGTSFEPDTDIVSLGIRKENTDLVYIGTSGWTPDEISREFVGQGIISVVTTTEKYVLENLGQAEIYLNSPNLNTLASTSYFSTPLITVVIEYLGRQAP